MSMNQLFRDESLHKGQYLMSNNGEWRAIFKGDGNFAICAWETVWESGTAGSGITRLTMEGDSNLVMYNEGGTPRWHTDTRIIPQGRLDRRCSCDCRLQLTDDGKLVLHRGSEQAWTSANSRGK